MTTLTDAEIEAGIEAGTLIAHGEKRQIGPACYELRAGPIYYDLTESDQPINAALQGNLLIKPGHRVVLLSMEEVMVPDYMIARISSKGSLFSIGLSPVSTYADPGFSGHVGIVTQNISDKYLVLPIGESIAKIDFSKLSGKVTNAYRGQHGYQTKIWPIRHDLQKTYDQVKSDIRVKSENEEADKIIPLATAVMLQKISGNQRIINIGLLIALLVNAVVISLLTTKYIDIGVAIFANLLCSAIVGIVALKRKR